MDFINQYLSLEIIGYGELVLRLFLAMLFGFILGIDRDSKNKPIDYRAYMIVAVATCSVAIMGQELYIQYASAEQFVSLDLGKIISGVLTGIGFLGAGAILKQGDTKIIGTATGASIWASGIFGLALGFGMYALAFLTFLMIAIILIGCGFFMKTFADKEDKENLKS